ncbi:MAG TPA: carboxymuconolactone decarboxylase family protein [Terracidiphilus sp.]|jgi:AhpD family alkylhydroperoxidase
MTDTATTDARIDYKDFQAIIPEVSTGMAAVSHALRKSGVEPELFEMIKVRISQLNGCAFCIQYHLNDARKLNIPPAKLDLLAAWREAGIYSERETAAFEWAERVTLLAAHHITDEDFARVSAHFSQREVVFITTAIGQINFWNRVAAPFRFTPPIPSGS